MPFSSFGFQFAPVDMDVQLRDGVTEYSARDNDPKLVLYKRNGIHRLRPGWYIFRARFDVRDGQMLCPCFYPDYGNGASEFSRIRLPELEPDGSVRAVVLVSRPLKLLRFDPSVRKVQFCIKQFSLKRISRPRAALEMLASIKRRHGGYWSGEPKATLRELALNLLRGRVASAGHSLSHRYQHECCACSLEYSRWLKTFGSARVWRQQPLLSETSSPLLTVVMPVCDPPLHILRAALDSVLGQSYVCWQLCIADDASGPEVRNVLQEYARREPRISLHFRSSRGHVARASNDALAMAQGKYVGFLDHDDVLDVQALREFAAAIASHPRARLLYCDEDKLDASGRRFDPNFKPAWNPELLRGQNYLCHMTFVERGLLQQLDGFREGFEGAQDHDLFLRCGEQLEPDEVVHIPRVLYHWRYMDGSTSMGVASKPYAAQAAYQAVVQHLERCSIDAAVDPLPSGHLRVRRKLTDKRKLVSIIIPTRDRLDLLQACVDSIIEKTSYSNYEIVVVDNDSTQDDTRRYLRRMVAEQRCRVVADSRPFNFSRLVNYGADHSRGELVCLLNNDIEVISPEWLEEMVSHALQPSTGVVGAMLYYPNETIQHAGVLLGMGGVAGHAFIREPRGSTGYMGRAALAQNVSAVTGACMVVRHAVWRQVDGFDERLAVAFNDIDFCLRVCAAGYRNVWSPVAELYHHESASRGSELTSDARRRFEKEVTFMTARWGDCLSHDPAYNPNLALDNDCFQLSLSPRSAVPRSGVTLWRQNNHDTSVPASFSEHQAAGPLAVRGLA